MNSIAAEWQDCLPALVALASRAGSAILGCYAKEVSYTHKEDLSPLTAADMAAHECLLRGLELLAPDIPVLSEESPTLPLATRSLWQTYWLVDPLDGTKEFISRNGEFTVNIALIHCGQAVLGVVYAPVADVCYFASAAGAYKRRGMEPAMRINTRKPASEPPVAVGSRSHGSRATEVFLRRLGVHERLSIGSSLKFCLVAEGLADIYPRLGPTSEWDTAAGQCVLESAGGAVVGLDGLPLRYNSKESLLNPWFLAMGDASRDWQVPASDLLQGG